jgi:hypothetical protein
MKKLPLKLALAAALTMAALSVPAPSRALSGDLGGCPRSGLCPDNYGPVICSNGGVYPNSCYAYLNCATDCVPYSNAS